MNTSDKPTVLVVDDQPKNLQLVAAVLKDDYKLLIADSGDKALRAAFDKQPNLILLDVMMPEMSGFDIAKRLKEEPRTADIPIVFLTAKSDTSDVVKGLELGGVDYILKPFHRLELLQRIRTQVKLDLQRREIRQKTEALNELNEEKTKLLSVLSHDLRNLIGGSMGLLQIMESDFELLSEAEVREFIGMVSASTTQTYSLMEDLLAWLKSQTGAMKMNRQTLSLKELTESVAALYASQARQKSISIRIDAPEEILFVADRNMMETVMRNLITNAIKFSHAGGEVRIRGRSAEGQVVVDVRDVGVGMTKERLDKLWSVFFESETGTDGEKGSGIGLNLCLKYVQKHGGTISAASELGKGSVFTIRIPDGFPPR